MRIDKIDLGRQSSGDRVGMLHTRPLGALFLTTREILTTHLNFRITTVVHSKYIYIYMYVLVAEFLLSHVC